MHLGICVPVYNEVGCIERVLLDLEDFLQTYDVVDSFELILVDGGSTDGTVNLLESFVSSRDSFNMISGGRRLKGSSINKGLEYLDSDAYVVMDGDGSVSLKDFKTGLDMLEKFDLVIGRRKLFNRNNYTRSVASGIYNLLVNIFFDTGFWDHQCGLKFFSGDVIDDLLGSVSEPTMFWDTAFLIKSLQEDYSVSEYNINWNKQCTRSEVSLIQDSKIFAYKLILLKYEKFSKTSLFTFV